MNSKIKKTIFREENYAALIEIENDVPLNICEVYEEEKLSLLRGDIVSICVQRNELNETGYMLSRRSFVETGYIFDGKSFIEIPKNLCVGYETLGFFNRHIPQGFPVIEEFPIHYWDKYYNNTFLDFNIEKYHREIIKNISMTSEFGIFDAGITYKEYKYIWSQFTFNDKIDPYEQSDASRILIEDLNSIVHEYLGTIYYIIFMLHPTSVVITFKKLLHDKNFRSKLKFKANWVNPLQVGKARDLKEYIMYVNLSDNEGFNNI